MTRQAIQEKREGRREKSILGKGSCMCKDPGAEKSLFCSQSTKEAGVVKRVRRGRRQVTRGHVGQMKALGLSPEHPGDTTPPSPSPASYQVCPQD